MDVEFIKRVITDQEEDIRKKFAEERIIERERLKEIKSCMIFPSALAILGVRRAGKTILSLQLSKGKKYCYINFDDPEVEDFPVKEYRKLLEAVYSLKGDVEIIILDEVHNINKWELLVNRIRERKIVIITGSNAKMLSKELADKLTGRYVDFMLFPFSFREYLIFKNFKPNIYLTKDIAKIKDLLLEFLRFGGFPEVYKYGRRYAAKIYLDIIEKDVIKRYNIKFISCMKTLAKLLISNSSGEISYNKLKNIIGVKSVHTIKNYVSYLQDAYLFFTLERFSFKLKQQIIAPKKTYCVDTGMINTIAFKFSENLGRIYENLVAVELKRRQLLEPLLEIYYWKNYYGREVDFVLKEGLQVKELIQVCYGVDEYRTKEREIKALLKASKELKCNNLLIITKDYEETEEHKGKKIKFIPLWKWLLVSS